MASVPLSGAGATLMPARDAPSPSSSPSPPTQPVTENSTGPPRKRRKSRNQRGGSEDGGGGGGGGGVSEGQDGTGKAEKELTRKDSLSGALARALVGTLAFVFRAPVRLFRPVKLSSWNLLETMAHREGRSLSLQYMRTLIRRERRSFLPHLLIPPLLVNTTIGFCLFEVYSLTEARLLHKRQLAQEASQGELKKEAPVTFTPLWIVAVAGGAAGAAQCIVSAPLDNVRIVLSSNVSRPKRHQHGVRILSRGHNISWRAVARAAILPFAPDITRSKLVQQVKDARNGQRQGGVTGASSAFGKLSKASTSNVSQRDLWEKRIKRWRGGVHGAGLIMSLARDSVGFSAFFVVFEFSRRLAYRTSLSVDRVLAYFDASAALPAGGAPLMRVEDASDGEHDGNSYRRGDISYSQSRTKAGRIVAAFVLIVGGAVGAAFYELVGRPAELMRLVIWEGRKAWEEGRRASSHRRAPAATSGTPGRARMTGARVASRHTSGSLGTQLKHGAFLDLRSSNSSGSVLSRVEALRHAHGHRPPHPLKLGLRRLDDGAHEFPKAAQKSRVGTHRTPHSTNLRLRVPQATVGKSQRMPHMPPLSTRPSAYTLLLEHAQKTSLLQYPSARDAALRRNATPVPAPILLFHTYFVAPFSVQASARDRVLATVKNEHAAGMGSVLASRKHGEPSYSAAPRATAASSTNAPKAAPLQKRLPLPLRRLLNIFNYRYPESNAPGSVRTVTQAQTWGSGRVAWTLRRLASPYGVGFLVFAWMSGDLSA